jgi:high-affinity iron transporter
MISTFVITFRESLEAALVIGIVLAYLVRTGKERYNNVVYLGAVSAVVASAAGAIVFSALAGGLTGAAEQLFEGTAMLIASVLITYMTFWMLRQKRISEELREKVDKEIDSKGKAGLFSLVFISVFREGVETVIFLGAASFMTGENSLLGAFLGIVSAIVLGYALFVWGKKINIKIFFSVTSTLLILFAAGMVAHSVHEFQEAGILPTLAEHIWDINPPVNADGTYPLLHEKGVIGSIAAGLFGYNANPSFEEVIAYVMYLIAIALIWKHYLAEKRKVGKT